MVEKGKKKRFKGLAQQCIHSPNPCIGGCSGVVAHLLRQVFRKKPSVERGLEPVGWVHLLITYIEAKGFGGLGQTFLWILLWALQQPLIGISTWGAHGFSTHCCFQCHGPKLLIANSPLSLLRMASLA